MDIKELLDYTLSVPVKVILGGLPPAVGLLWWAYKLGQNSKNDVAVLANEKASLANQRAVQLSEELEEYKEKLSNRDTLVLELERQIVKSEADLKLIAASRQNDETLRDHLQLVSELKARVAKLDELRRALLGPEQELWKLRGDTMPDDLAVALRQSRVKVIVVSNLKGGVGKTTITANLAAYYAIKRKKRVLLIDFDYQGSLTATLLGAIKSGLGTNILADALLGSEVGGRWLAEVPRDLGVALPQSRLITCGPLFDRFENQTMLRWLIGEVQDDIKFRLARLLVSPEVQGAYDVVLIDAPPRTSLGAVNALATAHALLVPTLPDTLSVDAMGRYLTRMTNIRSLMPALANVLVVPSLTQETKLRQDEQDALKEARLLLSNWSGPAYITDSFIRHFPSLSKIAGREVGYIADTRYVRPAFDALGDEVSTRIGLA